jgi:hypothetical protein
MEAVYQLGTHAWKHKMREECHASSMVFLLWVDLRSIQGASLSLVG